MKVLQRAPRSHQLLKAKDRDDWGMVGFGVFAVDGEGRGLVMEDRVVDLRAAASESGDAYHWVYSAYSAIGSRLLVIISAVGLRDRDWPGLMTLMTTAGCYFVLDLSIRSSPLTL